MVLASISIVAGDAQRNTNIISSSTVLDQTQLSVNILSTVHILSSVYSSYTIPVTSYQSAFCRTSIVLVLGSEMYTV